MNQLSATRKGLPVLLMLLLLSSFSLVAAAEPPHGFAQAKRIAWKLYADRPVTFYCQCSYTPDHKVRWETCDYQPRKNSKRAAWVEWEHIVPASVLGRGHACWKEALCTDSKGKAYRGRRCCEKIDAKFRRMEADLWNLVPAVGEVNADRRDYGFGLLAEQAPQYGQCTMAVNFQAKRVQPPVYTRGFIARIYLYMQACYSVSLRAEEVQQMQAWDLQYPPTPWEEERSSIVGEVMQPSSCRAPLSVSRWAQTPSCRLPSLR